MIHIKPKKKQRPNVHTTFSIPEEASTALSHAVLFLLNVKGFSFENEKISMDSAFGAEEKLSEHETTLTRGEVRATAKALDFVLNCFPLTNKTYDYIDQEVPGLISDIENELSLLQQLLPAFQQAVKDLKKMR